MQKMPPKIRIEVGRAGEKTKLWADDKLIGYIHRLTLCDGEYAWVDRVMYNEDGKPVKCKAGSEIKIRYERVRLLQHIFDTTSGLYPPKKEKKDATKSV